MMAGCVLVSAEAGLTITISKGSKPQEVYNGSENRAARGLHVHCRCCKTSTTSSTVCVNVISSVQALDIKSAIGATIKSVITRRSFLSKAYCNTDSI